MQLIIFYSLACIFSSVYISFVESIGCYKCVSLNSNDTACSDPFNPGMSPLNLYDSECKSGVENRIGLFPARFCLKVSGYKKGTSQQVVIRTCTVAKLLDSDSSYSSFSLKLDNLSEPLEVTSGLIASCKDDGCNRADHLNNNYLVIFIILFNLINNFLYIK